MSVKPSNDSPNLYQGYLGVIMRYVVVWKEDPNDKMKSIKIAAYSFMLKKLFNYP